MKGRKGGCETTMTRSFNSWTIATVPATSSQIPCPTLFLKYLTYYQPVLVFLHLLLLVEHLLHLLILGILSNKARDMSNAHLLEILLGRCSLMLEVCTTGSKKKKQVTRCSFLE